MAERAEDRDQKFLEITLPHLDALASVARHLTNDRQRAEDLVQETYLRAFAAFETHRGEHTKAWLVAICVNLARDGARRATRRVVEVPIAPEHEPSPVHPDIVDAAIAGLARETVARALSRLPEEQRVAIVLMDLAGHSASEVGEILGCPRNTVLSRVHRGHRRLAEILAREEVDRGVL
jgi:RNA polymerase sigma-70 factor (ECF subfamily)